MAFFEELKRRKVIRVSVAYVVVGWALVEAASVLLPMFDSPRWTLQAFTVVIALGFPLAVVLAWTLQWSAEGPVIDRGAASAPATRRGRIQFANASDSTRIAWTTAGEGPPLVKTAHWLTHLDEDWDSPLWKRWLAELASGHQLVCYDERGCGLSDRDVDDLGFDAFVGDLETVVDAAGLERFALFGASQGGPVSIAYAARHPDRVAALVLFGSYARGWRMRDDAELVRREEAMIELIRTGWGTNTEAFRGLYASLFVPAVEAEMRHSFVEMARKSTSPETAARLMDSFGKIDVSSLLPQISVPTLVLHNREDERIPVANGRELAAEIPGAEFVCLESKNHIMSPHEPAFAETIRLVGEFLERHWPAQSAAGSRDVYSIG